MNIRYPIYEGVYRILTLKPNTTGPVPSPAESGFVIYQPE